jgi:hypothetical protein
MLAELRYHFDLRLKTLNRLEPSVLGDVHLAILCTTEGVALDRSEMQELQGFVHGGGTAIVSAFSNWSAHDHFNENLVHWLGVDVIPHAPFNSCRIYSGLKAFSLDAQRVKDGPGMAQGELLNASDAAGLQVMLDGPFGAVVTFRNTGETDFALHPVAGRRAIVLVGEHDLRAELADSAHTLAFFPREIPADGEGVRDTAEDIDRPPATPGGAGALSQPKQSFRKGQVLVLSNLHCFADSDAWLGGHWREEVSHILR